MMVLSKKGLAKLRSVLARGLTLEDTTTYERALSAELRGSISILPAGFQTIV
jgi:hypothetical protein